MEVLMRKDWIEVELGTILVQSKEKYSPKEEQELFYVGLEHIEKELGRLTDINRIEKISTLKNKFEPGQILYGKLRPYLNKVYLSKESGVCSTDILVFQPKAKVVPRFAHLYMLSRKFVNDMSENTSGVNLPRVSTSYINSYPFPLPPLPEQRAIVARIEELFSELDHSIANLKSAQSKLEIYRQAVLKKAFEGGFTNNSKSVWKVVKFGEVTLNFDGKRKPLSRAFRENFKGDYRYYGACEIIDYVKDFLFDGEYLLIGEDGANLLSKSKPLAFIAEGKFWVNNHAHVIQPKEDLDIKFLCYQFNSLQINNYVTGTAQPKLSQGNLNKIPLKVCGIEEQLQIVQEIESRLSVADKLAESIQTNLEKAESLRQSILKKAFDGELLSDEELEACRKEADWEPAEKLLERIRGEKKLAI